MYLNILIESAWVATIIPWSQEPTFFAMKAFGGFNMPLAFALAVVGATLGHVFNWWLGGFMFKLKEKENWPLPQRYYDRAQRIFNRYLVFLLLFAWLPMFNFLVVASGFLGARLKLVLPLIIAGQLIKFGLHIL